MKHLNSSAFNPVPTNIMGQSLIYSHMSHHYRRLYNAKARVDCSPPCHFRPAQRMGSTTPNATPDNMAFMDEFIYDPKCGPAGYGSQGCCSTARGPSGSFASCSQTQRPASWKKPPTNMRIVNLQLKPADGTNRHSKCFTPAEKPFKPRILKSNAQSKVRDLKVYHPPRRKQPESVKKAQVKESLPMTVQKHIGNNKEEDQVDDGISSGASSAGPWMQMSLYMEYPCQTETHKPASEESSRDSAYNGGVSSGGESRGPTPEHSPEKPSVPPVRLTPAMEMRLRRQKEEALYVQFVHDITQDVLNSSIFSNKGLRQVFHKHINLNCDKLDMDRMRAEVSKLQVQLEMPDDEEDMFPVPSKEDIVLSWPAEEPSYISSEKLSLEMKPTDALLEMRTRRMQASKPNEVLDTPLGTATRRSPSGIKSSTSIRKLSLGMEPYKPEEPSVVDDPTMTVVEIIQSLIDMGFAPSMAEEICHSIADKEEILCESPQPHSSKKTPAQVSSPKLGSIKETSEISDPPSDCACSNSSIRQKSPFQPKLSDPPNDCMGSMPSTSQKSPLQPKISEPPSDCMCSKLSTSQKSSLQPKISDPSSDCMCSKSAMRWKSSFQGGDSEVEVTVHDERSVTSPNTVVDKPLAPDRSKSKSKESSVSEREPDDNTQDSEVIEEQLSAATSGRSSVLSNAEVVQEVLSDKSSIVEEEISEASDEFSAREELSEDYSSSDSSISSIPIRLKGSIPDKGCCYPTVFSSDKTDLRPREKLQHS